jgi:DUF4097 and DUF4098 domain-containing protein YvlB
MSRSSIVAMLVAVEILIAGMAIYVIGGSGRLGHMHSVFAASGAHRADFVAAAVAPIDAGRSPHIAVDDRDSRIVVATSNDGLVHVKDLTRMEGTFFSDSRSIAQLHVAHTADSVSISRTPSADGWGAHFQIGFFEERVEIDVPAGAHVDIARSSGADVTGIEGGVAVRSQDGHITLANLRGTVDAHSDDGWISATGVHGDTLTMQSADGHLTLRDIAVSSLSARTEDGRITASELAISGGAQPRATLQSADGSVSVKGSFAAGGAYEISSKDGSIQLGLAPGSDLTVDASTADGRIVVDGTTVDRGDSDSTQHTIRLGSGSGSLRVSSSDGSIHITTNGAV